MLYVLLCFSGSNEPNNFSFSLKYESAERGHHAMPESPKSTFLILNFFDDMAPICTVMYRVNVVKMARKIGYFGTGKNYAPLGGGGGPVYKKG